MTIKQMASFGNANYKSDVFENLSWIIGGELFKQLAFLHETKTIMDIDLSIEYIDSYIHCSIHIR